MTPKKIMVVEDEAALQHILVAWLEEQGYEALGVTTGTEAIKRIPIEKPDLVLLDLILPEINGFEVMKALSKNPATENIPVIVLTNLGDEEDRRKAMELGAKNYLVKAEYNFEAIQKIIGETLSGTSSFYVSSSSSL